ncbi:type II toxin-antitoxin system RelE/ParE family toxin [Rhizobium wuzhouense]|uniref:Type II toxin-antitoxin system RelE/ParE family toxin n=1 Tax=Rhizobium wuzhouense TaxID=1986026 RepID=A0ABX5NPZ3_9HYPH|nr:type II toxin-antitoxin system RelE/ParE family toxin [Rhizobium wuzhouense]PYB72322.1 type II toxin-antitoxin system RelE/ParE family toxin [Rhizobium wuzhouense]
MPAKLFWTPKARVDVKSIYIKMREEQPRSSDRYFANIRRKVELLIEHPRLGERHPEVFRTARMLVEAPYVILYEIRPDTDDGPIDTVEIVRVVDGRRDLSALYKT